jgi:hypothetical protein
MDGVNSEAKLKTSERVTKVHGPMKQKQEGWLTQPQPAHIKRKGVGREEQALRQCRSSNENVVISFDNIHSGQ